MVVVKPIETPEDNPVSERLWSYKAFTFYWYGRVAATAGNQILALWISWRIYDLTGSAWLLGMAGLIQFLPSLVFFLFAGDLADRKDRRLILVVVMVLQVLLTGTLLAAETFNTMSSSLLLGLCVVVGILRPFQLSSQQSLPPRLVPSHLLPRAMALSSAGSQGMFIAGPAIAGLLLIWGSSQVLLLGMSMFASASFLYWRVRYDFIRPANRKRSLKEMLSGFAFVRAHPSILGSITLDLFVVMLGGVTALLPIYAKDVLAVDTWGLGLMRGAPAIGALILSLVLARWTIRQHVGRYMFVSVGIYAGALLVFGLSHSLLLSVFALAVSGAADMVSVVIRQSLVQLDTPDAMRGKVSAINSVCIGGSNQLGEFRAGISAHWMGAAGAVTIGAIGSLVVAGLWIRWFPQLWHRQTLSGGHAILTAHSSSRAPSRKSQP
jgi:MFS family permease